jgi:sugar phosphate isomerase/epimerase
MKLGAYTACLHDRPLREALEVLKGMNLTGAEINSGGFLASPHIPIDALASQGAREEYLGIYDESGGAGGQEALRPDRTRNEKE